MTENEAKSHTEDETAATVTERAISAAAERAINDRLGKAEARLNQAIGQLEEARATVRGIRYLLAEYGPTS